MQTLINKATNKPVEIIDGVLVQTDTPTLFTDRATLDSIRESATGSDLNNEEYELRTAIVIYEDNVNAGRPSTAQWVRGDKRLPGLFNTVKWRNADGGNIPLRDATPLEHWQRCGANINFHEWLDEV